MILRAEGRDIMLAAAESASGGCYVGVNDPETEVLIDGNMTVIRLEGRDLPDCQKTEPADHKFHLGMQANYKIQNKLLQRM